MEQYLLDLFNNTGLDFDKFFTEEKIKKDLFDYYEATEIDATYMSNYQNKKGKWRRKLWPCVLTLDSYLEHRTINIRWDEQKDFFIRLYVDIRSVVEDQYGRYQKCQIYFRYNADLELENIRIHWDHGSDEVND